MSEHTGYLPGLSAVEGKQVQAAFDGGMPSSDAGVLLLRQVERRLGIGDRLAACLRDPRDPLRIDHTVAEMIRFRVFAIAAGYDDADDCDVLRTDPLFKMALGRGPSSGGGAAVLAADHVTAGERALAGRALAHAGGDGRSVLRELAPRAVPHRAQYRRHVGRDPWPATAGAVQRSLRRLRLSADPHLRGHRRQAGHSILRPGKSPSGVEARLILGHVIGRIRRNWPRVRIVLRGDGH